jgi:hypothetical protein
VTAPAHAAIDGEFPRSAKTDDTLPHGAGERLFTLRA